MSVVPSILTRQPVLDRPRDSDMTLLESAREMNRDALVEIFDLYSTALYNYAFRLCNDARTADYVVGDVFAKLLEQLSAGNGPNSNLRSYLYESTYHLIVDDARHANRMAPLEVAESVNDNGYSPSAHFEKEVLFRAIMQAIRDELTEDQRHVIILRFLEGFSLRETAQIVGKQVNYVKVIQNRGIAALRKVLGYEEKK